MAPKATRRNPPVSDEDLRLLDQWIEEVYDLNKLVIAKHSGKFKGAIPRPTSTPTAVAILKRDDAGAIAMVRAYVVKLQEHARQRESHEFMHLLAQWLLKRPLPFAEEDLIWLAKQTAAAGDFWEWPLVGIADALERHVQTHGLSSDLKKAIEKMLENVEQVAWHKSTRSVVPRLSKMVRGTTEVFTVDQGEPWAKQLLKDVSAMKGRERQQWNALLCHAQKTTVTKPSAEWFARAQRLVEEVGTDRFVSRIATWFPLFRRKRTDRPPSHDSFQSYSYRSDWANACSIANCLLLKGLIWCCWAVPDERNRPVLEALMSECYRETSSGKRFAEGGTACKRALEAMT